MKRASKRNAQSVADAERKRLEEFDRDDDRRPVPPLVESPSKTTLEAIEILRPWTLYKLLHLDALSATPLYAKRKLRAAQEAKLREIERTRWLKCETHLRAALEVLRRPPETDNLMASIRSAAEYYCASCDLFGHSCYTEQERVNSLIEWMQDRLGDRIDVEFRRRLRSPEQAAMSWQVPSSWDWNDVLREINFILGPILPGEPKFDDFARRLSPFVDHARTRGRDRIDPYLERVRADAQRSSEEAKAISRVRAAVLVERLEWTPKKIANLIISSEVDWFPPPVTLEPTARDTDTMKERFRNLIDPRSSRRR